VCDLKILIADDHEVVRRGLKQIIEHAYPGCEFGEAQNSQEVMQCVWDQEWDIVLLDISMPGRGGLDVLKELRSTKPSLPALVFSMHPEDQFAVRVIKAGASGYMNKETAPEELIIAIRKITSGGQYISPSLAEKLASHVKANPDRPLHELLSDREYEVFSKIASGMALKEIASELSLSVKTISTYRSRVLEKMQLRTTAQLIHYAVQQNIAKSM